MAGFGRRHGSPNSLLDVDTSDIDLVIRSLNASESDVRKAMARALRRTASSLRVRASRRIVPELQMRRAGDFRRRLRTMRARISKDRGEIGIWIGLNDMAVSKFKGRVTEFSGGAKFRDTEFHGAFAAKMPRARHRSIYRRTGAARFPVQEEALPIKDRLDVIIEDEIFPDAVDVFMRLFIADLRARTIFGVGKRD